MVCDGCMRGEVLEEVLWFFFFNDTATTEIYTLSLHDALPILPKILKTGYTNKTPLFAGLNMPTIVFFWSHYHLIRGQCLGKVDNVVK